jgi:hypothetical protein
MRQDPRLHRGRLKRSRVALRSAGPRIRHPLLRNVEVLLEKSSAHAPSRSVTGISGSGAPACRRCEGSPVDFPTESVEYLKLSRTGVGAGLGPPNLHAASQSRSFEALFRARAPRPLELRIRSSGPEATQMRKATFLPTGMRCFCHQGQGMSRAIDISPKSRYHVDTMLCHCL